MCPMTLGICDEAPGLLHEPDGQRWICEMKGGVGPSYATRTKYSRLYVGYTV